MGKPSVIREIHRRCCIDHVHPQTRKCMSSQFLPVLFVTYTVLNTVVVSVAVIEVLLSLTSPNSHTHSGVESQY